jgi:hypothetical protein
MMDVVCLGLTAESVAPVNPDPVAAIPGDVSDAVRQPTRSPQSARQRPAASSPDCASFPLTGFRVLIHQHSEGRPAAILDEPRVGRSLHRALS